MKKYISSANKGDRYYVKEVWTHRKGWQSDDYIESYGYLTDDGHWVDKGFRAEAKLFTYDAARSRVQRLNAKNTDESVRYEIEHEWVDEIADNNEGFEE